MQLSYPDTLKEIKYKDKGTQKIEILAYRYTKKVQNKQNERKENI